MSTVDTEEKICVLMEGIGAKAKAASSILAHTDDSLKTGALLAAADCIEDRKKEIILANEKDMALARERKSSNTILDRLSLNEERVFSISMALREISRLSDPVGKVLEEWERPNGLYISKVTVPIGVIGIIYEARPNVTADSAALCLKAGNSVIMRCGSIAYNSSMVLTACMKEGLRHQNLPQGAINLVTTNDRKAVHKMLKMIDKIDVIIPRGSKQLVDLIIHESHIPVIYHLDGLCHTYIHHKALPSMVEEVVYNAKMRRPGICNATETILADKDSMHTHLLPLLEKLLNGGCRVKGDRDIMSLDERIEAVSEEDFRTEYLDYIVSVKLVDGIEEAVAHINKYGSHHTDAILTEDKALAEKFLQMVDSGIVMHNASTQFADGGEFGLGAEIGISTGKLHARGPVGAQNLVSYKYQVRGNGQTRP